MPRNASVVASGSAAVLLLGIVTAVAFSDTAPGPGPIGAPLVISHTQDAAYALGIGGPAPGGAASGAAEDSADPAGADELGDASDDGMEAPSGPGRAATAPGAALSTSTPAGSTTSLSSQEPSPDNARWTWTSQDRNLWASGTATEWRRPSPARTLAAPSPTPGDPLPAPSAAPAPTATPSPTPTPTVTPSPTPTPTPTPTTTPVTVTSEDATGKAAGLV